MNNYYQNNVPSFCSTSKPTPAAPDYDEFLLEYISSDAMDRLDILACNSEIDGFIVFFDDQICYNGFRDLRITWIDSSTVHVIRIRIDSRDPYMDHVNCIWIDSRDLYTIHLNSQDL